MLLTITKSQIVVLSPFFCAKKPLRLSKLLIYPTFSSSLTRKTFSIAISFCLMYFYIFLGCCYCWLLFVVFCFILAIHSDLDFCTVSTKNSISRFFEFFPVLLTLSKSYWKLFLHVFLQAYLIPRPGLDTLTAI